MSSCPIENAGEESADDVPKTEAADLDATDREADGEREEDRQFRILLQGFDEIIHTCCLLPVMLTSSSHAISSTVLRQFPLISLAPSRAGRSLGKLAFCTGCLLPAGWTVLPVAAS